LLKFALVKEVLFWLKQAIEKKSSILIQNEPFLIKKGVFSLKETFKLR